MKTSRRMIHTIFILILYNIVFLWNFFEQSMFLNTIITIFLILFFIGFQIRPWKQPQLPHKQRILIGGCELWRTVGISLILQVISSVLFFSFSSYQFHFSVWIWNTVVVLILSFILFVNGAIRIFVTSEQLTTKQRVCFLCLWWMPVIHLFLFVSIYKTAKNEYLFFMMREQRNRKRKPYRVCATKYPILMVHGIFFRDWPLFQYWGRIPKELKDNGATIYYGGQDSSSSVEDSAKQLKKTILHIIETTHCEKVNIIAHSKGGLDARYAIVNLGLEQQVASLTTINTPHRGCLFAKKSLDQLPSNLVTSISKKYNQLFTKLGDQQADFLTGVSELTTEACRKLNQMTPNCNDVFYQSVGSKINTAKNAIFPLDMGYRLIQPLEGENDGLVAVSSMPWGEQFTMLSPVGKQGISHGDVIDLTRKDIKGFDVRELYVHLVENLKKKGC